MPDVVGLEAELVLTIERALAEVTTLETALTQATTGIVLSLDTANTITEIQSAVAQAVADASGQQVTVAADTTEIPTTIEDAVAAITPPPVPVDADTSAAQTSIDALADAPPVDVPVAADTSTAEQMILDLGNQPPVDVTVDANTDEAKAAIDEFATTIPPITIEADADLSGATEQVANLGTESTTTSDSVSGLSGSVTGLGVAAGITEGSAKELLGAVGDMGGESTKAAAIGIGTVAAATAGFFAEGMQAVSAGQRFDLILGDMADKVKAIDVNGLKTDMAALGIQFGSTEAEMENVNAKLFQNAINTGASKDQAVQFTQQIETLAARAISLNPTLGTLADVTDNLGARIARGGRFAADYGLQLSAAEINTRALANTGKTAAVDLTVTEKAIAGAQIASEKYGNTLATTVADGSKNAAVQLESLKAQFKEAIEQIGTPLVSPVLDLIRTAEPDAVLIAEALGRLAKDALPAVSAALAVIGPPLQLVAAVLDAIPDPIITGTIAFLGLNAALEAFSVRLAGVEAETAVFAPEIAVLAAAAAAVVGVISVFGDTPDYSDNVTKAIDAQAKGFDDLTVSVRENIAAEVDAATKTGDFAQRLMDAGLSSEGLTDALILGGNAWRQYTDAIAGSQTMFGLHEGDLTGATQDLLHLRDATEQAAQRTLEKAVADGKLSQADMNAAVAQAGLIDGSVNFAAALDAVQPKLAANEKATADKEAADKKAKAAADDHASALQQIATENQAVAMTMVAVQQATDDRTTSLEGLAVALGHANLGQKEFDAVAADLGVTSSSLKAFVDAVTKSIDDFANTALGKLPDVSSAIDMALDPKKRATKPIIIDPDELAKQLDAAVAQIDKFNLQVAFLTQNGYNNLAKVAAERGPEFTDALVSSIQNSDMGGVLEMKFAQVNQRTAAEGPILKEVGSGIVKATGEVADDASNAFGSKFDVQTPTATALTIANRRIDDWTSTVPDQVGAAGKNASDQWWQKFSQVDAGTSTALGNAQTSIDSAAPGIGTAAGAAGAAGATGFGQGIDGVPTATKGAISEAVTVLNDPDSLSALITGAYTSAKLVGAAFDDGLTDGIKKYSQEVSDQATQTVNDAENAARVASQSHSPSQVFAAIGEDMAAGLAQGISDGSIVAANASADLATQTAAATQTAIDAAFAKAATNVSDNAFKVGIISSDQFLAILNDRLTQLVPLSDAWTAVVLQIQQVTDSSTKDLQAQQKAAEQAAQAEAAAQQKAAQAAAAVAADHQRIHDVQYQVGDLSGTAYLDMLNQRMAKEEEAGHKYSAAWKAAYDEAQRVKAALSQAELDKPFTDLAAKLGVSVDKLHTFADQMKQAIDAVATQASSSLPSLSTIISNSLDTSGVLDTTKFQTNIDDQIKQVQAYTQNVDALMAAGLTHTAQLAIEQGPAAAAALAAAGSSTLESSLGQFDDVTAGVAKKARDVWGPQIVDTLGETAKLAGQDFGDQFTDTFLAELNDKKSPIREMLNSVLGLPASPTIITPATGLPIGVMPIGLPSVTTSPVAAAVPATGQFAKATQGMLLQFDKGSVVIDTGGVPVTDANAATLGQAFASKLADQIHGRLAGVAK